MLFRSLLGGLGMLAIAAIIGTFKASADIQTVGATGTFTSSSAGTTTPWLNLSGQSTCAVIIAGSATGFSITVNGASDTPAPSTAVTVTNLAAVPSGTSTSGIITANGTYSSSISTYALTGIQLSFTSVGGGTGTYKITCSGAGGGGSSAGGAVTVTSGNITVTNSPAPTASPGGYLGTQQIDYGSTGNFYIHTIPDTWATPGPITTSTTTTVIAAVAGASIWVWYAGVESSGTNTNDNAAFYWGTAGSCTTLGALAFRPQISFINTLTQYQQSIMWGTGVNGTAFIPGTDSAFPYPPGPAGQPLCGQTTGGTATAIYYKVHYAQH